MRVSFESKGDFEVIGAWLKKASSMDPSAIVKNIAQDGTRSLVNNTPKMSGETASGWREKINRKGDVAEVIWYNVAHPELRVNLAKLIDLGHGTGTGGYVPAKPYIRRAMNPIWSAFDSRIIKEMIK